MGEYEAGDRVKEAGTGWDVGRFTRSCVYESAFRSTHLTYRSMIDNFDEFWRIASKIFPVPSLNPPPAPSSVLDPHPRSQSTDPGGQSSSEKDGAYSVRSVPCRLYLPDGPVLQDLFPPLNELGESKTSCEEISNPRPLPTLTLTNCTYFCFIRSRH